MIFKRNFFGLSGHFVKNKKVGNHFVKGLVKMVDGVEHIRLHPISFPVWFLLNVILHYQREAQSSSNWWVLRVFLNDFHAPIAAVESISLHWVSAVEKLLINNWRCTCWDHRGNFSSMKQSLILVNPLPFALDIVIKVVIFRDPQWYPWETRHILYHERFLTMDMRS